MKNSKKDILYNELNKKLAEEYLSTPEAIQMLRSLLIGKGYTKKSLLEYIEKKDIDASLVITQIMRNMSIRNEVKKWLTQISSSTLQEMLYKNIDSLGENGKL